MMAASLVVKVIGAFFQIPLQNLIGGEKSPAFGMFSAAYRIYTAMLVISTVGLPAALSKMVAEATARGREYEVRRIVRVAAGIFVPVGALCSLALFYGAGTFASWIKSEDSRLAVMAIAPSVLMVAILSVFRGYYQGRSNMVPTAVSQVIEAAGKLFIGLGLAYWAVGRGFDDPVVAALTVLGVTIGEVVAAAYMLVQAALSAGTGVRGGARVKAISFHHTLALGFFFHPSHGYILTALSKVCSPRLLSRFTIITLLSSALFSKTSKLFLSSVLTTSHSTIARSSNYARKPLSGKPPLH